MNKYQEALDKLKENYENVFKASVIERDNEFYEDIDTLQELVDRATAKEGIDVYNAFGDGTLSCPSCKKPIINVYSKLPYMPNYCHHCGQRFKWSRSDEE